MSSASYFGPSLHSMTSINSLTDISIKMDDFKNSTFPSYSFIMGDMSFHRVKDSECIENNTTFVKLKSSGNSITIATLFQPNDEIFFQNCAQLKEDLNYHICTITVNETSGVVCLKMNDNMNIKGEFELVINFNPLACLYPTFDSYSKCNVKSFLDYSISIYSYPGENAKVFRNFILVFVLIFVFIGVTCLVSCSLIAYCCLIRRRQKLLRGGSVNLSQQQQYESTELVDEE